MLLRDSPDQGGGGEEVIGCDELRIERGVSATATRRPIFEALVNELEAGDTLVLWALDRAFRSSTGALTTMDSLRARGVHLSILSLGMDTATPTGRLIYTVVAGLAEFERDTLSLRTKEGMAAARRRGVRLGRPRVLDDNAVAIIKRRLESSPSVSVANVAASLGCSRHTIYRALQRD